jgi:hypothetical protein
VYFHRLSGHACSAVVSIFFLSFCHLPMLYLMKKMNSEMKYLWFFWVIIIEIRWIFFLLKNLRRKWTIRRLKK